MLIRMFLLPEVNTTLNGTLQDVEDVKDVTTELNIILFYAYSDCCVKLLVRLNMFVAAKRDYFERK